MPLIAIPEPADNAETTLAFVKYKLPLVSITLAVYNPVQFTAEIVFVLIRLAPVIEPPEPPPIMVFAVITLAEILFALIKLAPVIEPPKPVPEIIASI